MSTLIIAVLACVLQVLAQDQGLQQEAPGGEFIVPRSDTAGQPVPLQYNEELSAPGYDFDDRSGGDLIVPGNDIKGTAKIGERNRRFALGYFPTGQPRFEGLDSALSNIRQPAFKSQFIASGSNVFLRMPPSQTTWQVSSSPTISWICVAGGIFKDIACATECRLKFQGTGYCSDDNVCMCKELGPEDILPEGPVADSFCLLGDIVCAAQCRVKGQGSGYCTDQSVCMCVEMPVYGGRGLNIM